MVFSKALHTIAKQLRSSLNISPPVGPAESACVDLNLDKNCPTYGLSQILDSKPPIKEEVSPQTEANYAAIFGDNSHVVRLLQAVAIPIIGNVCHAFMHSFNQTEVYGVEKLTNAVLHRPQGQALITVSNHVASMDDPLVLAAMLPPRVLLHANFLRWTLCATDRCFTNAATSAFFRCVKVLPLARGSGVYQKGIDLAVEKLKEGDWVHIFPEGSRSRDGGKTVGGAKRGIGRLVLDAGKIPLVVPFVHSGMQEVMPIGSKFPSIKKKVIVLVGNPIKVDDLIAEFEGSDLPECVLYEAIAFRVGEHLKNLKAELEQLVSSSSCKTDNHKLQIEVVPDKDMTVEKYQEQNYNQSVVCYSSDGSRLKKPSFDHLQEAWLSESRLLAGFSLISLQEGMVTRLKKFMDPAVFVGFAAQGLLSHSHGFGSGRFGLRK